MELIDTHHHILPPDYVQAWNASSSVPRGLVIPSWSPSQALRCIQENDISSAILSLSAPALTIVQDKAEAATLAREINSYAASLRDLYPTRFGFLITLPSLTDVPACLSEIEYGFDHLSADGITLLTCYNGRYLGHPDFRPLWEELNKRSAVVFVHPAQGLVPPISEPAIPGPILDFPHETTRSAVSMIIGNVVHDYPNLKIILSHAGGTLPYMATRIASQAGGTPFLGNKTAEAFLNEAKTFYYDLALSAFEGPFDLLRKFARRGHILYGSDFPFAKQQSISAQAKFVKDVTSTLDDTGGTNSRAENEGWEIRRGNALRLFPRLARRLGEGEGAGEGRSDHQMTNGK
ncbi:MAG: hypothetical protein Q9202_004731 [Teloschistes flavicans]